MSLLDTVRAEKGMTREEVDEYMSRWKNANEFEYEVFPGTIGTQESLPVWHIDVYRKGDKGNLMRLVQAWTTRRAV